MAWLVALPGGPNCGPCFVALPHLKMTSTSEAVKPRQLSYDRREQRFPRLEYQVLMSWHVDMLS
jgi:hypothetical protein